ncbi:MAG: glycosyltransferase [Kiritimatiellae bacterium]|nr:glycosyltransferase [Kiritimatiellia bacterium]
MKIIHLNTNDFDGGAYRAAFRLHRALRACNEDSTILVAQKRGGESFVYPLRFSQQVAHRVQRAIRRAGIRLAMACWKNPRLLGYESFDVDRSQYGRELVCSLPSCDVVHLHHIAGLVDYETFFPAVWKRSGIVWTLHDMNCFTGGCHYDHGCGRWRNGCGACPQLGSRRRWDLSAQVWQRKRRIFEKLPTEAIFFVSPSRWLAEQAGQSPLVGRFAIRVIPNGVDLAFYRPRAKSMARELLGLPSDGIFLLFVAQQVKNRRKGFHVLSGALQRLRDVKGLCLVTVGIDVPVSQLGIPVFHLGHVSMPGILALAYNAADFVVVPSLQDNLPNTVLEAFASGTPVIGTAVGGLIDLVRPGLTGWLVPPADATSLCEAIREAVSAPGMRDTMSGNCRRMAEENFSDMHQAGEYLKVYTSARCAR